MTGVTSLVSNKIWDLNVLQIPYMVGEPPGTRTLNPLIKSQQGTEQLAVTLNFSDFTAIPQVFLSELARFSTISLHAIVREFLVEYK